MTTRTTTGRDRRLRTETLAGEPALARDLHELSLAGWPPFMLADEVARRCWPRLLEVAPDLQFVLRDEQSGAVVAGGHAVPCWWDGSVAGLPSGWDAVLDQGCQADAAARSNVASALAIVVDPAERGTGLSGAALAAMRGLAADRGFRDLIAPVRPNWKHRYPLIPMVEYLAWVLPDGRVFDPWLRTHTDAGARILRVADESMLIEGTVAQWEAWTGTPMPGPGAFLVPEGLVPVVVDPDHRHGRYVEPNVWVHHRLGDAR